MKALLTILFAAAAMPALAAAEPSATASEPGEPGAPRLVCHRVPALSGSHVSRTRICRTAAQWRAVHDGSVDDDMDGMSPMVRGMNQPKDGYTSSRGNH